MSGFNIIVVGVALAVVGLGLMRELPPKHSPLAPLSLADPIGWATGDKLSRLAGDESRCRTLLTRAAVAFQPVPDRADEGFCGYTGAVALAGGPADFAGGPVRVSCPLAAALQLWIRDVVDPAARERFGVGVRRIEHAGTYACRRVYGRETGPASEHATANAIDVTDFRLASGRVVSVRDWASGDGASRAFLRDVRDGGCRVFVGVLGPDYNLAHRDHFHLDMGRWRVCR